MRSVGDGRVVIIDEIGDMPDLVTLYRAAALPSELIVVKPPRTETEVRAALNQPPDSGAFMQVHPPLRPLFVKDETTRLFENITSKIPPARSRVRNGRIERFRRKSLRSGPVPAKQAREHKRVMRKMKIATTPEEMEKARITAAKNPHISTQIAHRSSPAKRAKLRARR